MGNVRDAIMNDRFPSFLRNFFKKYYRGGKYPRWIVDALNSVGVNLLEGLQEGEVVDEEEPNWDVA